MGSCIFVGVRDYMFFTKPRVLKLEPWLSGLGKVKRVKERAGEFREKET